MEKIKVKIYVYVGGELYFTRVFDRDFLFQRYDVIRYFIAKLQVKYRLTEVRYIVDYKYNDTILTEEQKLKKEISSVKATLTKYINARNEYKKIYIDQVLIVLDSEWEMLEKMNNKIKKTEEKLQNLIIKYQSL